MSAVFMFSLTKVTECDKSGFPLPKGVLFHRAKFAKSSHDLDDIRHNPQHCV